MDKLEIVEQALRKYKRLAYNRRYGGMMGDYHLAQDALEALGNVRQPGLFDAETSDEEVALVTVLDKVERSC